MRGMSFSLLGLYMWPSAGHASLSAVVCGSVSDHASGKSYPSPTTNGGRSCDIFGIWEHRKNPHLKLMTRKVSLSPQRRCVLIAEDRGPKQESECSGFESLLPRVPLGHNCLIQSNFFMLVLFLHQTLLKIYMGCPSPWVFISLWRLIT